MSPSQEAFDTLFTGDYRKHNVNVGSINDKSIDSQKLYDRFVSLDSGGYDKNGQYWGIAFTYKLHLRVKYNADLSFVYFYRGECNNPKSLDELRNEK